LDEIVQELLAIRQMLGAPEPEPTPPGATRRLFGCLGQGTWDEYDLDLDWARFSTP
jgi:hypothetical protein